MRGSAQHIIARQRQTIEKLRSETNDEGDDEGDDDKLTPEASKIVSREVRRHVEPLMETLAQRADEEELQGLLVQEPESKQHEKTIRAYMKNPHYKGVPPAVIYHHLAFDAAAGSKKKDIADLEAKQNRGGGTIRRPIEGQLPHGIPSVEEQEDMTDAQFEELQHKARSGVFVPKE